ncbi:endolytic transglycosylase MltG [Patescibacteria group bacterium]|nr:endolytic transglycosylase MltG [Patescibacteria group bacterium]
MAISYNMDLRNILRLATVVEKEEKNNQNKPTVAGIFFNRFTQ